MSVASGQKRSSLPALLAVAACFGAGLLNLHLLTSEIDTSPISAGDIAADQALDPETDLLTERAAADPSEYPVTLARPLFRSTRRPPAVAEAAPAKKPEPARRRAARLPQDLQLVGIVKESGKAGRALIRSSKSPTGEWIEVGHVLEGWRLSRIEQRSILFETDGQKQQLSLFEDKDSQAD